MTSLWVWSIAIDAIETQRIKQGIKSQLLWKMVSIQVD